MNKVKTSKKRIAITTAALVAVGGGAAFAYWTSTGNGTGAAQTGTTEPFTVTETEVTGGPLSPGGPSQTVEFDVTHAGTGVQRLNSVVVKVANADGSAWTSVTGCSAADYTVGTAAITGGDIAANATKSGTVTITMNNLETNQDGCKGQAVPLYFTAS